MKILNYYQKLLPEQKTLILGLCSGTFFLLLMFFHLPKSVLLVMLIVLLYQSHYVGKELNY